MSELSENELRLALADSTHGFVTYRAGPSPRSDSARRLAGAGAWAMEGGEYERAFRLLRAAYALGVEDSLFISDTGEMLKLLRCPRERVALYAHALRHWPAATWATEGRTQALEELQRQPELRKRRCLLDLPGLRSDHLDREP